MSVLKSHELAVDEGFLEGGLFGWDTDSRGCRVAGIFL